MFEKLEELAKNNKKISDFHIKAGSPLAYRQTGEIHKVQEVVVKKQDLQYCFACGGKDITKNIFRKYFPWNNNKRAFNRFEIKESIKFFLAGIFNNQLINKIRFFSQIIHFFY